MRGRWLFLAFLMLLPAALHAQVVGNGTIQLAPQQPSEPGRPTPIRIIPRGELGQPVLHVGSGATPAPSARDLVRGDGARGEHGDEQPVVATPKGSSYQSLVFWLFALLLIGGAIMTITRRNAVTAVMFLVGTFMALSGLYAMLYAHFIAVIQVLVYAGAIMVLFVFVVMILNKEEEEPWALRTGLIGKILAVAGLVYLLVRTAGVLYHASGRPGMGDSAWIPQDFGTTQAIGKTFFTTYLFPFEAVSIVLLIAVVGALVLAHPGHPNVGEEDQKEAS